jgi:hypothetical protein
MLELVQELVFHSLLVLHSHQASDRLLELVLDLAGCFTGLDDHK